MCPIKREDYSKENKQRTVELTELHGAKNTGVALNPGINADKLGTLRKAILTHGQKRLFPGEGYARSDEVMPLKRALTPAKKESDFLKDAAARLEWQVGALTSTTRRCS